MILRDFDKDLEFGREGEHIVARYLIKRGSAVSPLYQYVKHDSAPKILWDEDGRAISCVLPDLHGYKAGNAYFAEVKRKNQWWYGEVGPETGMNLGLWKDYLRIRNKTGCALYVFFLHEKKEPTGLFYGEITALDSSKRIWREGRVPLVFLQHAHLTKASELIDLEINGA